MRKIYANKNLHKILGRNKAPILKNLVTAENLTRESQEEVAKEDKKEEVEESIQG